MSDAARIEYDDVSKYYGDVTAAEDVSFTIEPGEFVGIVVGRAVGAVMDIVKFADGGVSGQRHLLEGSPAGSFEGVGIQRQDGFVHRLAPAPEVIGLTVDADGEAVGYALWNLEERGVLFIGPGEKVYKGMIIGENAKPDDLDVNPLKAKQLTNIRAAGKDDAVTLTPPVRMSLEEAIAYIEDDELVEVTPKAIRLRKRFLDPHERKRQARASA